MKGSELPLVWYATNRPDDALLHQMADAPALVATCGLLNDPPEGDAVIIDAECDPVAALRLCRAVRHKYSDDAPPIMVLTADERSFRLPAYQAGADVCLGRPFGHEELLAQLRASLRWSSNQRRSHDKSGMVRETNRELQQAYAQLCSESELAGRLQSSFTPLFPEIGRVRFAVHYRVHGTVGSDCCDAVRLDERHVGFWLADAMTHGVPAALLTAYLKQAVCGKEIASGGYRIVPPAEVLSRLNRDLLAMHLSDPPLATMIYGTIDCFSGEVSLARAAHPQPIVVSSDGRPTVWHLTGTLLGVGGAGFATETKTLAAGDRLVLVSDGLCDDPIATEQPQLLNAIRKAQSLPLGTFVESVAHRLTENRVVTDDATLFTLEYQEKSAK